MFYRTSLQIQQLFAEMFHLAVALRTIVGPADVDRMPLIQKRVAAEAIQAARQGLNCCLRSNSYREGLKYGIRTLLTVNEDSPFSSCTIHSHCSNLRRQLLNAIS